MNEQKGNINQVRQVLVNELGLTRDSIRDIAKEFISQTVTSFFSLWINEEANVKILVQLLVKEHLDAQAKPNQRIAYRGMSFGSYLERMVHEEVSKQVAQRLNITLRDIPETY